MKQKRILVVDDEQDLCEILLYNLKAADFEAEAANSAEIALDKGTSQYDLLILDVMMPGEAKTTTILLECIIKKSIEKTNENNTIYVSADGHVSHDKQHQ